MALPGNLLANPAFAVNNESCRRALNAAELVCDVFAIEQNALAGKLSVRAGLMSADSQFLQSQTAANFINNGISWPTFLAANLPAGGPAYPLPAPGVRVRIQPVDEWAFQAAVFSGDPSGGNGSNQPATLPTGTVVSFRGGAFFIAEASYLPNQGKDAKGLPGAYRLGAWYHTSSRFADQRVDNTGLSLADPQSTGIPLDHTGDSGVYGVIDQMLYRVPGSDDKGLSAFVRAGGVPNDRNLSISMPMGVSSTKDSSLAGRTTRSGLPPRMPASAPKSTGAEPVRCRPRLERTRESPCRHEHVSHAAAPGLRSRRSRARPTSSKVHSSRDHRQNCHHFFRGGTSSGLTRVTFASFSTFEAFARL